MEVETGGSCEARGKSGEVGCLQFLPTTWQKWSKDVLGYTPVMNKTNELYVAVGKIQSWLNRGYNAEQIATLWNSGGTTHIKGINSHGVAYDTLAYARQVLSHIK